VSRSIPGPKEAVRREDCADAVWKKTVDAVYILFSSLISILRPPTPAWGKTESEDWCVKGGIPSVQEFVFLPCNSSSMLDIRVGFAMYRVSRPRTIDGGESSGIT
jgi:hypothetical protein